MDVRVREEMERFFGEDRRRIAHALTVHAHAIRIQAAEGGDRETVVMAALLHDVGIVPAEALHGSDAGRLQEAYGPPVAEIILRRLGADEGRIAAVKEIIAHHHTPGVVRTKEFACLWDADMIVNLEETVPGMDPGKIRGLIEEKFLTAEGKRIARRNFLGEIR
jgi:predicted HD phosphohydrolase